MIRVSVMYPKGDDSTFDLDYYKTTHMGLVERDMGVVRTEVDSGVDGPYVATGHLYFESMEALQKGMANATEVLADIPNFTNAAPVMQTSEVVS